MAATRDSWTLSKAAIMMNMLEDKVIRSRLVPIKCVVLPTKCAVCAIAMYRNRSQALQFAR
jgi:hypothetical protein